MTIEEAVALLKQHNKWRRGDNDIPMTDARKLGTAIDVIVAYHGTEKDDLK
jgi:hypothetical protein